MQTAINMALCVCKKNFILSLPSKSLKKMHKFYCFRSGKHAWSFLTKQLSGRIRTARFTKKMSTMQSKLHEGLLDYPSHGHDEIQSGGKEKVAVLKFESEEEPSIKKEKDKPDKPNMDFSCIMMEAKKEFEKKNPNKAHLKMLLRRSHDQRRKEIKAQDAEAMPMMSSILLDWPLLEEGQYVSILAYFMKVL